jgi:hypothetical protein
MSWFKRKTEVKLTPAPVDQVTFEIETHKEAKTEAVKEAKEASEKLNQLLVDNGFTLKIYLATGGKVHKRK